MGAKGQKAWNKTAIDEAELAAEYAKDRGAVRRLAEKYGCSIMAIYARLESMGLKRRRGGDANAGTQARELNPNWKGGRRVDSQGYVVVNIDGSEVREHRIVAKEKISRALLPDEVVHHIDGNRSNNHPDNLVVLTSQAEHMREHMTTEEARRRGRNGGWRRRAALMALKPEGE